MKKLLDQTIDELIDRKEASRAEIEVQQNVETNSKKFVNRINQDIKSTRMIEARLAVIKDYMFVSASVAEEELK